MNVDRNIGFSDPKISIEKPSVEVEFSPKMPSGEPSLPPLGAEMNFSTPSAGFEVEEFEPFSLDTNFNKNVDFSGPQIDNRFEPKIEADFHPKHEAGFEADFDPSFDPNLNLKNDASFTPSYSTDLNNNFEANVDPRLDADFGGKIEIPEKKSKFKFKLPSFGGKSKASKTNSDASSKFGSKSGSKADLSMSFQADTPKFDASGPKIETDFNGPKFEAEAPSFEAEMAAPSFETDTPKFEAEIKSPEFQAPSFGVQTETKVRSRSSSTSSSSRSTSKSKSKGGGGLFGKLGFGGKKNKKVEINGPEIRGPEVDIDLGTDVNIGSGANIGGGGNFNGGGNFGGDANVGSEFQTNVQAPDSHIHVEMGGIPSLAKSASSSSNSSSVKPELSSFVFYAYCRDLPGGKKN